MNNPNHAQAASDWWRTAIIDMQPGSIKLRGRAIQELIGQLNFAEMIWLLVVGSKLEANKVSLFEAALVAGVDHGPQAPSIAAARMAATCGISLNNVLATGVNTLGDVHGGAGEQCAELYYSIAKLLITGDCALERAVRQGLDEWSSKHGKIVSGFGHRFHKPTDPRAPKLMQLVRASAASGAVSGQFADIAEAVQLELGKRRGNRPLAMNIDGATAVIFCELGVPAPLARGFFCLSRSVGILAHGWEQMQQGERNKGPMPKQFLPSYIVNDNS